MELKHLFKPHVYVKDINEINFSFLKSELGIKYLIFDKDDTLSSHNCNFLHHSIQKSTLLEISTLFKENVFICSNANHKWSFKVPKSIH